MNEKYLTTREVAHKLNISESSIRNYCQRGIISPKRDKARNWRWFSDEEIEKIKSIIKPV